MKKFRKKVIKAEKKGILTPLEAVKILMCTGLHSSVAKEMLKQS